LILLTRQYRDIKQDLEKAKLNFLEQANSPGFGKNISLPNLPEHNPPDNSNQLIIPTIASDFPAVKQDTETGNKNFISDLVNETLEHSHNLTKLGLETEAKSLDNEDLPNRSEVLKHKVEIEQIPWNIPDSWNNASPIFSTEKDLDIQYNQEAGNKDDTEIKIKEDKIEKVEIKESDWSQMKHGIREGGFAKSLWEDMGKLKQELTSMHIEKKDDKPAVKRNGGNSRLESSHHRKKDALIHDMIQYMQAIHNRDDINILLGDVRIKKFLDNSHQDFQTLLSWLNDYNDVSAKAQDICDGLENIYKNVLKNIHYIKRHLGLQRVRSGIEFIGEHIGNADHPLLQMARNHVQNMDSLYEKNLEVMSSERALNMSSFGEFSDRDLWKQYETIQFQLEQFVNQIWEIEASEERLADLDDWRHDYQGINGLAEIDKNMVDIQGRIDGYTNADLQRNWTAVEKDLQKLQEFKVQGMIHWLSEGSNLPPWVTPNLKDFILEQCHTYIKMDAERKDMEKSWFNIGSAGDTIKLNLDVLYSQIRTCVTKVKYSSLENTRHTNELKVYSAWLDTNGSRLREQSRNQLQDLIQSAQTKVDEVQTAINLHLTIMSSSKEEHVRQSSLILEKMREEKRECLKQINKKISKSCSDIKYKGVEILSYADPTR